MVHAHAATKRGRPDAPRLPQRDAGRAPAHRRRAPAAVRRPVGEGRAVVVVGVPERQALRRRVGVRRRRAEDGDPAVLPAVDSAAQAERVALVDHRRDEGRIRREVRRLSRGHATEELVREYSVRERESESGQPLREDIQVSHMRAYTHTYEYMCLFKSADSSANVKLITY